jgi:hypothetical protein
VANDDRQITMMLQREPHQGGDESSEHPFLDAARV